jgi:hypothetical protein
MKAALVVSAGPHAPCQVVREYVYVYSAVAPAQGEMTSLILPSADTAMMNLFLEHVSQTFAKCFIVMQVDGAGWHHSDELVIPSNIRLIEVLCQGLGELADDPERLRSLTGFPHLNVTI